MIRDFIMSAEEAKGYGIIDNVIVSRGELVSPDVIAAQAAASK
jgi:ATP-dependent protease ClpP protease subunit